MVEIEEIKKIAYGYIPEKTTIGVLGSHSAEEVGIAAASFGFPVVVVCQKGRDELYSKYNSHLFSHIMLLEKFSDIELYFWGADVNW